jgi:outer membrane protein insertion porin family
MKAITFTALSFMALGLGQPWALAQTVPPGDDPTTVFGPDQNTVGTQLGGGGVLAFGLSYGNAEGVSGMIEVTQQGLFGTDEDLRFYLEGSQYSQNLGLSFTDADFLERPISRTIRFSGFNVDANEDYGHQYGYSGADASISFERHTDAGLAQRLGFGVAQYSIDVQPGMPVAVGTHVATYGSVTDVVYAFGGLDLNRAEPGPMPGRGYRAAANLEVGQAAQTAYAKLTLSADLFYRLATHTTLRSRASVGLSAVAGGHDLPLFKTYQGGGIGSVRGFVAGTMGPVSAIPGSTEVAFPGGQSAWSAGIEVAQEITGVDGLHALVFYDFGDVSGSSNPFDDKRSSAGVGLIWESPVGPLSIYAAQPMDTRSTDRTETVQIAYGVRF